MLLVLLTALPGILVCYYIFRADRYEREPLLPLLVFFLLGAGLTLPVLRLEQILSAELFRADHSHHFLPTFFFAFGVVACWEELAKWLLLLAVFPWRFFNEPMDGIVYAVVIAMGFGTAENLLYVYKYGIGTLPMRVLTAIPAHLVFAIVQGYFAGKALFSKEVHSKVQRFQITLKGFFVAFLLHGCYDFLLFQQWWQWLFALATASIYLCLYYCHTLIRIHVDASPFRK